MSDANNDFNPADIVPRTGEIVDVTSPVVASYAAKVGETFTVNADNADLKLIKAEPSVKFKLSPGQQPPDVPVSVLLLFEGPNAAELPEGTYLVESGECTCHLHLMPILSPEGKQLYQAVYGE